jgi:hypothetical protein
MPRSVLRGYAGLRIPTGVCRNQWCLAPPAARLRNAEAALVVSRNGADHQRLTRKARGVSIVFMGVGGC